MTNAGFLAGAARRVLLALAAAFGLLLIAGSVAVAQAEAAKVLIYSGTTGYRHSNAGEAIQPAVVDLIQQKLTDAGIESDYRTCNGTGTGSGTVPGCRNATLGNPAIFTAENLDQYDAIFFWQASSQFRDQPATGPLFTTGEQQVIEEFVNDGGGIAAMHASVTMGAGSITQGDSGSGNQPWTWWDAPGDSAIGALMPGHSATDINNVARVEVSDRNHPSTRDLPDTYMFGDEHYTFSSNVRGTHHVLMTLDEESYNLGAGVTSMGADHPIAWCRMYDGGRVWASSLGHFAASYLEDKPGGEVGPGDNELIRHLVGGVEWVAGTAGADSDCGGTVWSNFSRTVLETGLNGAIGLDVATDGKVYWTEIGLQGVNSEGQLRMWDPDSDQSSTLLQIPTRAEYQSSNLGVLGMALDPDFESNRHLYVYYSPRIPADESNCVPQQANCVANNSWIPWHNLVSRFTLNAAGDAVVPGSEQEILRVRRIAVGNNNQDGLDPSTYSAHQGGAGLSFDNEGNLYLGTGDDVDPFGDSGNYAPIDQRFEERYDARNTSANTNDLRGKILRITPKPDAAGAPGVGTTYEIPDGNMFEPGTPQTRPEIYAMGFRNPFTVHADPANPGRVVVGEYGPDAGSDNATRGPAGVIEWDHVSEPGFYGWPLCVGDNSNALSYNRYTFPSGPSGARFDCSASGIPNESEFQTGLEEIPGPAIGADIWSKPSGTPPRFNIPNARDEANTGPIYDYDPSNPSETKWPAYYDGSWLIFNRNQNYWREARIRDDGDGLLRVNGFFPTNQFGAPAHNFVIPTRFGPDGSLYLVTWSGGCCRAQLPGLGQGALMRIDYAGEQPDLIPPVPNHSLSGNQNQDGAYIGIARLTLTATDQGGSGVDTIEYSVNGGPWLEYGPNPVPFDEPGDYVVTYRATDRAENTSDVEAVEFTVVPGDCVGTRSDEFDGEVLDTARWGFRHPTTPANGAGSPRVEGGNLVLPLGSWSLDLDRQGPVGLVGQPLPDGDFTMTTRISAPGMDADTGSSGTLFYAQAGIKLYQTDGDWVKVAHTRNADGNPPGAAPTYFEIATENGGTRTLGDRAGMGSGNLPTWWMRITRSGDQVSAAYSLTDPDEGATWTPLTFSGGSVSSVNLNTIFAPGDGPIYIGPFGGSGSVEASYDYVRFTPDEDECDENGPPVINSISAGPSAGDAPLEVDFSVDASDPDEDVLTYEWDFGDGSPFSSEQNPTHTYTEPGVYEAAVAVSDGEAEVSDSVTVTVTEPGVDPPPALRIQGQPKVRKVGPKKKQARFRFRATNPGDAASGPVRLCVKAAKKKLAVKGKACVARPSLAPGQTTQRPVKLRVKPKARGKTTKVTLIARGPDVATQRAVVRVKAKR